MWCRKFSNCYVTDKLCVCFENQWNYPQQGNECVHSSHFVAIEWFSKWLLQNSGFRLPYMDAICCCRFRHRIIQKNESNQFKWLIFFPAVFHRFFSSLVHILLFAFVRIHFDSCGEIHRNRPRMVEPFDGHSCEYTCAFSLSSATTNNIACTYA